jgi:hypothetical protein
LVGIVLGNPAEVRNGDFSFHDTGQRIHEAFGLAQRQMKDLTDKQSGFDRDTRILLRLTAGSRLGWAPVDYRLDRKVTTLP